MLPTNREKEKVTAAIYTQTSLIVRKVPVTGDFLGTQEYNGYCMCNPKVSNPYFLDSLKLLHIYLSLYQKGLRYPYLRDPYLGDLGLEWNKNSLIETS